VLTQSPKLVRKEGEKLILEQRIVDLEKEVADLKRQLDNQPEQIIKMVEENLTKTLQESNQQFSVS